MTPLSGISRERAGIRELRHEVRELRRANDRRVQRRPATVRPRRSHGSRRSRRRLRAFLVSGLIAIVSVATVHALFGTSDSRPAPNGASLTGLSMSQRIVTIANSQVGYSAEPTHSYCNKFSAYWHAGTPDCPGGDTSEEWCADFAAWVWQKAGVPFGYGFNPGQINAGAASFYAWGIANGHWHPATSGFVAAPGDVAVYGLVLGAVPSAAHVAIVTETPRGQRGPDVVNGDGDRTGFSVVESGTDQTRADDGHDRHATLSGYVSPS
jgi:CHAP domain